MSFQAPPTLLTLGLQSLLRDQALAISALKELPGELFPPLMKAVVAGRHLTILQAMVAAWPFPCLPMGALVKFPDVTTLQAVLAGVDMQLTGIFRQRKRKLQVLDLSNVHHDFWDVWAGTEDGARSAEMVREKQRGTGLHRYALRRRLKVVTNLCFGLCLDEHHEYLLQWAQERRGSLQLYCRKMHISPLSMYTVRKVLKIFQPECIEELVLNGGWTLPTLTSFAPCLGQMRNLRKFFLTIMHDDRSDPDNTLTDAQRKKVTKFKSQFSKLNCLQHLSMSGVYFLSGHMKQLLWCLKTPLEFLSISFCSFSQADLESFAQCHRLHHLKHLQLGGVILSELSLVSLRIFLENVPDTLQILELEGCRMKDSQISSLFPALSQCSQLTRVNFYDNDFSMAVLKDLLYHTANLSHMAQGFYPAPLECYVMGQATFERFNQLCSELRNTLCTVRQHRSISIATQLCLVHCPHCDSTRWTRFYHSWQ
ncbi:PRAME family member 8-like [Acomys russatus]|uniref:PRAME family member 8-like n=1 Tax=Acomys russatus TaxID=60746 RepID=UPI0021E3044F|nr:PRAME family member 8-like [Acomys russatus]